MTTKGRHRDDTAIPARVLVANFGRVCHSDRHRVLDLATTFRVSRTIARRVSERGKLTLQQANQMKKRNGFTLVELLMVISLIALLMTISFAAFGNAIGSTKEKATASTIQKISRIVQQRTEAFDRLKMKDAASRLVGSTGSAAFPFPPIPDIQTAETIVRKQRFQFAFPQRAEERSLFNGVDYGTYFTNLNPRADYESSALLYLSITQGETFGVPQVDDDSFLTSEVQSKSITIVGKQIDLKYFVDAWGQPLRFYRWPTSLIRPVSPVATAAKTMIDETLPLHMPAIDRTSSKLLISSLPANNTYTNIDPLSIDPDDPTQRFSVLYFRPMSALQKDNFRKATNMWFSEGTYHTPLIVSAGPDNKLGLLEPNGLLGMNSLAMPIPGVERTRRQLQEHQ